MGMTGLSVVDVYRDIAETERRKRGVYEAVRRNCEAQIRLAAARGRRECTFRVPVMTAGLPIYDVGKCADYIRERLVDSGFCATRMGVAELGISWEVSDLESQAPAKQKKKKPSAQSKTFHLTLE